MDPKDIEFDFDTPARRRPTPTPNPIASQPAQKPLFASQSRNPPSAPDDEFLSPLEQEVLDEYGKLVGNLDELSAILAELASQPSAEILDALRGLERKTTTVFTLLKASVYSIVLQQEIEDGGE